MARNIVELYTIIVEIVEDSQAKFITFSVVWLGNTTSEMIKNKLNGTIPGLLPSIDPTLQCVRRVL